MPFGAERQADGAVQFQLWAPAAHRVDLELLDGEGGMTRHNMWAVGDGWRRTTVATVAKDARYRFRIEDRLNVPDPASRFNPQDVHGASAVVDPESFEWPDGEWRGRPWEEAVVYELHIGAFTPEGTFRVAAEKLDYLAALGITAVQIMPVAEFPGQRNWGYDGVLPFAPDASYGSPEDLKTLVSAAHARGLMVILDVVYNHFGPEGNYLHAYAPQFFTARHHTPWGDAIDFSVRTVREFFIHNALYWLEEFHFDGLRLDAVHAILDDSRPHILEQLARAVRSGPGRDRQVHIILENDCNQARYLRRDRESGTPIHADAQWNDDFHHAAHVLTTGERDGYYRDYADRPLWHLGRTLAEGFGYQGEPSIHRGGVPRGEPSAELPSTAFIDFVQSHDQVGNRARGERLGQLAPAPALKLTIHCLLLAPATPMLFMGEEFNASTPFLYFCDFGPELAQKVSEGRKSEFAAFERFGATKIPEPNAEKTFSASKLRWAESGGAGHREWVDLYRRLLELRRKHIVPHLARMKRGGRFALFDDRAVALEWDLGGARLRAQANFSNRPIALAAPPGPVMHKAGGPFTRRSVLPAWSGIWTLELE
jgi:malto-oligosyltrehalose trehalohydrolase